MHEKNDLVKTHEFLLAIDMKLIREPESNPITIYVTLLYAILQIQN